MIRYKEGIMERLKEKGYSSTYLRKNKILGEKEMTQLRRAEEHPSKFLNKLCKMLDCKIEDIIEYVPDEEPEEKEQ